jgi:hypothetical protein
VIQLAASSEAERDAWFNVVDAAIEDAHKKNAARRKAAQKAAEATNTSTTQ